MSGHRIAKARCCLAAVSALLAVAAESSSLDPEPALSLLQLLAKPLRRIDVGSTNISDEIATLASLRDELAQLENRSVEAASELDPGPLPSLSAISSRRAEDDDLTCSFAPRPINRVAAGEVQSRTGATTEECLAWCLGDAKCLSVVFEPGTGSCHALPDKYSSRNLQMITTDQQAVVVDKSCTQQCGFSMPRNGRSPLQVLKHLRAETFTACKRRCASDQKCLSVVYRKNKRDCWLKKQPYDQNLQFSTDDAICSNKICPRACTFPKPQLLSAIGGQADGIPRSQTASTLEECQRICAASSSCSSIVYDSALTVCFVLPPGHERSSPHIVGTSNLVVSQKQVASQCSCASVPAGKCMTGCDGHGPDTRSAGGESINQCQCNYAGTDCTVEETVWACNAQRCTFTANRNWNEEEDAIGPPSQSNAALAEAAADGSQNFEHEDPALASNKNVSISDVAISQRGSASSVPPRKEAGKQSEKPRSSQKSKAMDEAAKTTANIAADAARVNDALDEAADIAVIPSKPANSSGMANAQATVASPISAYEIASSGFEGTAGSATNEGKRGAQREHQQVLLGGQAYSAKDASRENSVMNFTLEAGQGFSVAFTASWYSLQDKSRALAIFDDDAEGVRMRISNVGSTSTLALAVHRDGQESLLKVPEAISVGVTSRFLCTFTGDELGGRIEVYRDGERIGLLRHGLSLGALPHGRLFLAGGPRENSNFEGWLSDVCTWKRRASWQDASTCVK